MKSIFLSLLLTVSGTTFADALVSTAEFYKADFWPGEYPNGYKIMNDLLVETVRDPANPIVSEDCTLKKNSVIHPWARKTKSEFVYYSPVDHWVAEKDFEMYIDEFKTTEVRKGDAVTVLTYLAEGICRMQVNGQIVEDSCFGAPDDRATQISTSPFTGKYFFKTRCRDGVERWVDSIRIEDMIREKSTDVDYADVLDYGTVDEP